MSFINPPATEHCVRERVTKTTIVDSANGITKAKEVYICDHILTGCPGYNKLGTRLPNECVFLSLLMNQANQASGPRVLGSGLPPLSSPKESKVDRPGGESLNQGEIYVSW